MAPENQDFGGRFGGQFSAKHCQIVVNSRYLKQVKGKIKKSPKLLVIAVSGLLFLVLGLGLEPRTSAM